jgi:hypothetical protein
LKKKEEMEVEKEGAQADAAAAATGAASFPKSEDLRKVFKGIYNKTLCDIVFEKDAVALKLRGECSIDAWRGGSAVVCGRNPPVEELVGAVLDHNFSKKKGEEEKVRKRLLRLIRFPVF